MNGYVNSTEFANLLGITSGGICHMLEDGELPAHDREERRGTRTVRLWKEERAKVFADLYNARRRKARFMVTIPDNLCRKLDRLCKALGQTRDEVIIGSIKTVVA